MDQNNLWRKELADILRKRRRGCENRKSLYGSVVNNFHFTLPYSWYWRMKEDNGHLDKPNGGYQGLNSELFFSKTFREFSMEVGDVVIASGVPAELFDGRKYSWEEVREKFPVELYNAYKLLRSRGYSHKDLTA